MTKNKKFCIAMSTNSMYFAKLQRDGLCVELNESIMYNGVLESKNDTFSLFIQSKINLFFYFHNIALNYIKESYCISNSNTIISGLSSSTICIQSNNCANSSNFAVIYLKSY